MPVLGTLASAAAVISNFHKLHRSAHPDLVYSQTNLISPGNALNVSTLEERIAQVLFVESFSEETK